MEESGGRFSKPHVGTLSLDALQQLKLFILNGVNIFQCEGKTLDEVGYDFRKF